MGNQSSDFRNARLDTLVTNCANLVGGTVIAVLSQQHRKGSIVWTPAAFISGEHVARKPVFGVSDQVQHKLECTTTEDS